MSTITWTVDFGVLGEHDVEIEYDYSPGRSGVTSGPPERCYPDEPAEVEFTRADGTILTKLSAEGVDWLLSALQDDAALADRVAEVENAKCNDFWAAKAEYEAERYADELDPRTPHYWDRLEE